MCAKAIHTSIPLHLGINSFYYQFYSWDYLTYSDIYFQDTNYTFSVSLPTLGSPKYSPIEIVLPVENNQTVSQNLTSIDDWKQANSDHKGVITSISSFRFRLIKLVSTTVFPYKAEVELWNPSSIPVIIGGSCICNNHFWLITDNWYNFTDDKFWYSATGGYDAGWSEEIPPGLTKKDATKRLTIFNWNQTILPDGEYELFYDPDESYYPYPTITRPDNYHLVNLTAIKGIYQFDYFSRPDSWDTEYVESLGTTDSTTEGQNSSSSSTVYVGLLITPQFFLIYLVFVYLRRKNQLNI
jgi:hypothetical protein